MHGRTKKRICYVIVAVILIYATKYLILSRKGAITSRRFEQTSFLTDPRYPGTQECGDFPCLGNVLCQSLSQNLVRITNVESFIKDEEWTIYDAVIYDKYFSRKKMAVVHILSETNESHSSVNASLNAWRHTLCKIAGQNIDCDPTVQMGNMSELQRIARMKGFMKVDFVRKLSHNLECASQRLVNRIVRRSASPTYGYMSLIKLSKQHRKSLIFKLMSASRIWMREVFPSNEKWPFGMTLGACGRVVVNKGEYGTPLPELFTEPWKTRVDLAVQVLEIFFKLTSNENDYFFGLQDVSTSYFVRNSIGKLMIDIYDEIVIKDTRKKLRETSQLPLSCYSFNRAANMRAACRILAGEDGLLHDSEETQDVNDLMKVLLNRCLRLNMMVSPYDESANELYELLSTLRPCNEQFFYRFPECQYRMKQNNRQED